MAEAETYFRRGLGLKKEVQPVLDAEPLPTVSIGPARETIALLPRRSMPSIEEVAQPMLRIVGLWQQFQQARIAVARLGDIMNAPTESYSLSRARAQNGPGSIQIESLSFRYADNLPFLYDGFNLNVSPGQVAVIMAS